MAENRKLPLSGLFPLEVRCSIQLSYGRVAKQTGLLSRRMRSLRSATPAIVMHRLHDLKGQIPCDLWHPRTLIRETTSWGCLSCKFDSKRCRGGDFSTKGTISS